MDLEKNADELAALMLILAGITIVGTTIIASLFLGTTTEIALIEKIGGWMFVLPTGYLFGKSKPNA